MATKQAMAVRAVLAGVLLLTTAGCAAALIGGGVALGAGAVAYVKGDLNTVEEVGMDQLWLACQSAVAEMGYSIVSRKKSGLRASLRAKASDDKDITIKLKERTPNVTEMSIRVGILGDEAQSRLILKRIRERV